MPFGWSVALEFIYRFVLKSGCCWVNQDKIREVMDETNHDTQGERGIIRALLGFDFTNLESDLGP